MERWLDERILCGHPEPITRRQAMQEMMANGFDADEAVKALCYFKAVK
jgi:hypothetical protein